MRLEVLGHWLLSHGSREKTRRGGVGSTSGHYSGEGSIPFPESLFSRKKNLTLGIRFDIIVYVRVSKGEETRSWTVLGSLQNPHTTLQQLP